MLFIYSIYSQSIIWILKMCYKILKSSIFVQILELFYKIPKTFIFDQIHKIFTNFLKVLYFVRFLKVLYFIRFLKVLYFVVTISESEVCSDLKMWFLTKPNAVKPNESEHDWKQFGSKYIQNRFQFA